MLVCCDVVGVVSKPSSEMEETQEDDQRVSIARRPHPVDLSIAVRRHQRRRFL